MSDEAGGNQGLVFNIQRFSINDGPGIRTTVFLKGCPLHCPWCSNPESQAHVPELLQRAALCIKCTECEVTCPEHAITVTESAAVIDRDLCRSCMDCTRVCTSRALEQTGKWMSVADVLGVVLKDKNYYRHSQGGLTLSGGEPLLQWQFAAALCKGAKEASLHTALDTSGYANWASLAAVLEHIDLVLYDIKHLDASRHLDITGISNDTILENLRRMLGETDIEVWIRVPLIPQFNASREFVKEMAAFIQSLPRPPAKISLLPFHKLGTGKYIALGRMFIYQDVPLLSPNIVEEYRRILENHGLNVEIGG